MRKIIVDLDVGTDDYLALLYLLNFEKKGEVKILGIVCSYGNTSLDCVVTNVVRLLEIVGRTDIPIFKGAKNGLILAKEKPLRYHGEDGFGDMEYDTFPDISIVSKTPAAVAINEIVSKYPNDVTLICLAPLTNLALAIKLYDDLILKIKDVWIMGGNYTGVGNCSRAAEFNFHIDPEAAYIVLENLKCPIFIFPWETCLVHEISLEWRFKTLGNSSPELTLLTKAEKIVNHNNKMTTWVPCDVLVAFCFVKPEKHIRKQTVHHASVELHGDLTRGQVVLDHMKTNACNVTIIEDYHKELFINEMLTLKK